MVVPGGGALADEVRACQSRLGFGDASAHRMALLAMDQLAWAVAGLRQGFTVGATEAELRDALERGSVAVWAPYALIAGRTDIEESWRLTSDSLALWLAARLGAARCYLIKSIARPKAHRLSAASSRATASSMRPLPTCWRRPARRRFCSAAATSRLSPPPPPRADSCGCRRSLKPN